MKRAPIALGFVADSVDTISFLSLSGMFAAHITGNFVLLAATLVGHPHGVWSKLASLPVFIFGVWLAGFVADKLPRRHRNAERSLLAAELILLLGAFGIATAAGPFADADQPLAMVLGVLLATAMAIQNALGPLVPPTTRRPQL